MPIPSPFRRARRLLAIALIAAVLPVASGCGASFGAATQEPYTPGDGVQADSGALKLRNIVLVFTGTNQATLVGTIFNEGSESDALVSVTPGGTLVPAVIPVPAKGHAVLGQDTDLGPASTVVVTGESLRPGLVTELTFTFQRAASVSLDVLIEPRSGPYTGVPLPPSPSPSPEPSPTLDLPQTQSPEATDTASPAAS